MLINHPLRTELIQEFILPPRYMLKTKGTKIHLDIVNFPSINIIVHKSLIPSSYIRFGLFTPISKSALKQNDSMSLVLLLVPQYELLTCDIVG